MPTITTDIARGTTASAPASSTTDAPGSASVADGLRYQSASAAGSDKLDKAQAAMTEGNAAQIIAGWKTNWAAGLPQRSDAENARLIAEAVKATEALQHVANLKPGTSHNPLHRGFQAKGTYAATRAVLRMAANLPEALAVGPFAAGARYDAVVRMSNASPTLQDDKVADQRGIAVRIQGPDGRIEDLTFTSGSAANHARDAEEFIASIKAAQVAAEASVMGTAQGFMSMAGDLGPLDAARMAKAVKKSRTSGESMAATAFYSRAPFQLGPYAVKLRLVPATDVDPSVRGDGKDALMQDMVARRREGDIRYKLQVQGFADEQHTPMGNHAVPWDGAWVTMGEVVLPKLPSGSEATALRDLQEVSNGSAFSPFNQWDGENGAVLKPLGDLNMLRRAVYDHSAEVSGRGGLVGGGCPFLRGALSATAGGNQ